MEINRKKTAQEIQDDIFRKMSADERIKVGSQLWRLAKELVGKKVSYATQRPQRTFNRSL